MERIGGEKKTSGGEKVGFEGVEGIDRREESHVHLNPSVLIPPPSTPLCIFSLLLLLLLLLSFFSPPSHE